MKTRLFLSAILLAAPSFLAAQDTLPRGNAEAMIGSASVSVDYGRPDLGGRDLADLFGMLREERVWRAGENQVTILETSADVMIGGHAIPAGRYSLYLHIPEDGDWSLLVNRNQGIALGELWSEAPEAMRSEMWPRLDGYTAIESDEVARIPLSEASGSGGDVFEVELVGGMIRFSWAGVAYEATLGG